MSLLPVALYGLEVPAGDTLIDAVPDFPATFRITMAALDPSEPTEVEETTTGAVRPRATLKIVRLKNDQSEDDEDSEEYMRSLLADSDSSDDGGEEEEEVNGGPSDPNKTKKARKTAALKQLMDSISGDASDEDMEDASNGTKADKKGKAKATSDGDEESEVDSDDEDEDGVEEFVLCTLDPEKNFQQPLDITVGEGERVYFKVSGTHTVYLTGNYLIPDDKGRNPHHEVYDSDEDEDYDLSPDEHELDMIEEDDSDHLDDLEDPRITEIGSGDEEQAPKLITATEKKGKNKRPADEIDEGTSLDDLMAKSLKSDSAEEPKLSKKQLKKLKKNNGEAAAAKNEVSKKAEAARAEKNDKKVQFAKNLEQGPTGNLDKTKPEASSAQGKVTLGVKTVDGVKIDDKKLGSGRACKKGDKVGMRYIGKLLDGKVFDANRKGPPFTFKLGAGEVIRGWDIGVAGMSVGGERRLTIPASKAYGNKSMGPDLPANSTLVFDIKLLEIK